jgi:hypothetical protein
MDETVKTAHNERAKLLAKSYEKSAAHAAFMAHHTTNPRERRKYEQRVRRYKAKAREAWNTIIGW